MYLFLIKCFSLHSSLHPCNPNISRVTCFNIQLAKYMQIFRNAALADFYAVCNFYPIIHVDGIWRGMPGDKADVPAPKLPFTYRISTLLLPLQSCRSRYNCVVIFLKGLLFASASDSSGAGTRVSKSGTWAAALWRGRRLRHLVFLFICISVVACFLLFLQFGMLLNIDKKLAWGLLIDILEKNIRQLFETDLEYRFQN